jgi:hypothetical protein
MVTQIGDLSRQYQRAQRDGDHQGWGKLRVREEIGDVLWHLTAFADDLGLDMADVAVANLTKTADRWIPSADWHVFDADFPAEERLPSSITYEFQTYRKPDSVLATKIYCHGAQVGDTLTDASRNTDSYRLHDVFQPQLRMSARLVTCHSRLARVQAPQRADGRRERRRRPRHRHRRRARGLDLRLRGHA